MPRGARPPSRPNLTGIAQELDGLGEAFFGLVDPGDIGERRADACLADVVTCRTCESALTSIEQVTTADERQEHHERHQRVDGRSPEPS